MTRRPDDRDEIPDTRRMLVGLALPGYDLESGRTLRIDEVAGYAEEAEQLGFDSVWLMDHFWIERGGHRIGSHDPIVTAAAIAARTSRVSIGFLVLCNPFRPVGQLGREAAALADLAPGRLVLGLGSGWLKEEFDAFGYPFERLVSRLEETLQVLPPLLRGESVDFDGAFVRLRGATLLTTAPAPPIWVAAFGPRMLRLTAQHADGWNTAWHGPDATRFHEEVARLRAAAAERSVTVSVGMWTLPLAGEELRRAGERAERLRPADASWPLPLAEQTIAGSPEEMAAAILRYRDGGADHLILNPSPTPFSLFDASYPERLSQVLPLLR
jgi:alkanesulfonate monooxygenase SsuD/methylene tetrahydromethanopterin reductase-like flavin-dependent oxidoreductase (luciferase family)